VVDAQVLVTFYAELRRCRDHCDGRTTVRHYTAAEHRCVSRCTRHVCRPLAQWTVRKIHFLTSAAYSGPGLAGVSVIAVFVALIRCSPPAPVVLIANRGVEPALAARNMERVVPLPKSRTSTRW
jgi:hypothetical protein